MAIGRNKKNNESSPLSPGDSSGAVHISPPLPGRQSFLLDPTSRRLHDDMMRRIASEEIQVREELGEMSHYNLHPPSLPLPDQNIEAPYQLQFINKVQDPTFTTDLVRDKIGVPIKVAIFDTFTQSIILSSAKVRIMVVDAEYWNVLSEREGKGPILTGHSLSIQLKNGVGTFENIVFNDNSSWTKNGFRLAVMVKGEREGYFDGKRVQEGVSERFRVKDRHGKASQKPDRLELTHSVRCIKKIGKGRASFLEKKNINKVEDFLKLYYNDEPALREMLGIKSESGKGWESMIGHVMQCDDEYKKKCIASNNSSQPQQVPIIEGDVSAINRQHVPISNFPLMNLPNQPISAGRMVQYTGERHNAGGDGGNYSGIDGGTYGGGGNYGGASINGGTYSGGGNYGGASIDGGTYGGAGIGNYGGAGIGNYGGRGGVVSNYGSDGIGNYGGGIGIGNYCGGGGDTYGGGGISNYGGSGGVIGNYGGNGIGNYSSDGIGNYSGGIGIDNYGGGGIGIGNCSGGGTYGGGGGGTYGGAGIDNYGGGGIGNYDGRGGVIGNYGGDGIGNYGGGVGIGNYGGGGCIGNYGGGGCIGNYGGGVGIGNYGGGIGIDNYGGGGGGGIGNYGGGGSGIGNYGGGGIDNYGGGGGDWFGRSFTEREGGLAVSGLEGLSLEGSQTGG